MCWSPASLLDGCTSVPLLAELHLQVTQYANAKLRKLNGTKSDRINQTNIRLRPPPTLSSRAHHIPASISCSVVSRSPMLMQTLIRMDLSCRLYLQSGSHPTTPLQTPLQMKQLVIMYLWEYIKVNQTINELIKLSNKHQKRSRCTCNSFLQKFHQLTCNQIVTKFEIKGETWNIFI